MQNALLGFWIPFLFADLGNFAGGGISSYCIRRGWSVLMARKLVIVLGGIGMTLIILLLWTSSFAAMVALFSVATFSYAAWSTMALTLPADLYSNNAVASVSGMSGAAAGAGTIISTFLIGRVTDRYSFGPVLIGAGLVPAVATLLVLMLVRPAKDPGDGRFDYGARHASNSD